MNAFFFFLNTLQAVFPHAEKLAELQQCYNQLKVIEFRPDMVFMEIDGIQNVLIRKKNIYQVINSDQRSEPNLAV